MSSDDLVDLLCKFVLQVASFDGMLCPAGLNIQNFNMMKYERPCTESSHIL